ncbi:MAG: LysM peptidoglycan-binding domain-containing protein [Thioalkalispiraceae bacterium]|jgi:nucleoid-associated protein YgaU
MKTSKSLKLLGMMLLAMSIAVGCAGTPEGGDPAAAIAAAKAANERAKAEGYEWRDTGKLIKKAEEAMKKGDNATAIKLADQAREQAEMAVKQKYAELERLKAEGILGGDEMAATASSYEVVRGDNLWNISGKDSIYGNPYQWPLIYKANSNQIKDADLIYPGQTLQIDTNPSDADAAAAIQHAKTRGSWSIGVVEESDKAYLAQ